MRSLLKGILIFAVCGLAAPEAACDSASLYLSKGWEALEVDRDAQAIQQFALALENARRENDTVTRANALLYLGISSYGTSLARGFNYAILARKEFEKLERTHPAVARQGRSQCLQLISTITARRGNYREAIAISREAMKGLPKAGDTTGTLGLIFNSLGEAYSRLGQKDSGTYYFYKSLEEHRRTNNQLYLPTAFVQVADIELERGNYSASRGFFEAALAVSNRTENRQAQVLAHLGLGRWYLRVPHDFRPIGPLPLPVHGFMPPHSPLDSAGAHYTTALNISEALNDRTYKLKALEGIVDLKRQLHDYKGALEIVTVINKLKDSIYAESRQHIIESLEIQFKVAEKDRQLKLAQQEKEIALFDKKQQTAAIISISIMLIGAVFFLRRINKKDKLLLQRKEELLRTQQQLNQALEEKHRLAQRQFQANLEHKESQLSALTMQMLQKTELLQELKVQLEKDRHAAVDTNITKILNRGLSHDQEWADFNRYFESINQHFYSRLKQEYQDISPNDLKICALIKMNLSIKEMAGILNISPDSVKTARYRLRKKLRLNTEDNLTDFILQLQRLQGLQILLQ